MFYHSNETKVMEIPADFFHIKGQMLSEERDVPMRQEGDVEERVQQLLDAMTLEEKAGMLCGVDMWNLPGVERLGVPGICVTDCGHGVCGTGGDRNCATCFPTAIGQAATWNTELMERMGAVLGREVRSTGHAMLLGPMVNIHRTPLNGRSFECYSEDPFLAGKMAAALIRGVQSQGVGACIKGLTANNQQADQKELNVIVSERALREIYLPNFRIPVAEARPWAVMTCYNGVNGHHSSDNHHLLSEIVKGEWGFDGFIVSDWRGTHCPEVIEAGLDLEMPGPGKFMRREDVVEALDQDRLTEEKLDDRVRRLLRALVRARPVMEKVDDYVNELDAPPHRDIARELAEESVVLLKNEDDLLPLDAKRLETIAVVGPSAEQIRLGGRGSAAVSPSKAPGPLEALREACGRDVQVFYEEGCGFLGDGVVIYPQFLAPSDGDAEREGLRGEFFANDQLQGDPACTTLNPQIDFAWGWASPGHGVPRNGWSVRWEGRLKPPVSGRYRLGAIGHDGGVRLYVDGELLVDQWGSNDEKLAEVTGGHAELELTEEEDVSVRLEYRKIEGTAGLRLEWTVPGSGDSIERAAAAAAEADRVIVCGGICSLHEGGTCDREDLGLPGRQNELIEAVASANPDTTVVLFGGGPFEVESWIENAKAVLHAWYPGEQGGAALADILMGEVNPSGRLPDTFPKRLEDTPAYDNYPGDGEEVRYEEGIFVGYRHYDTHKVEPSFPFGYGLSYTQFRYDGLRLSSDRLSGDEMLTAQVDVENVGDRPGRTVVQLYVRDAESSVDRPIREMKGFAKVGLESGERRTVEFTIGRMDLSFFDPRLGAWHAESGEFAVQIGRHSRDGLIARFNYTA